MTLLLYRALLLAIFVLTDSTNVARASNPLCPGKRCGESATEQRKFNRVRQYNTTKRTTDRQRAFLFNDIAGSVTTQSTQIPVSNMTTLMEPESLREKVATTGIELTTSMPATTPALSEMAKRIAEKPGVNWAIDAILVVVAIQTMLGLGCTMDISLIKEHLLQPMGIGIAAACQFGIMPLVAFLLAKIFGLDKVAALAVIVTSSCPGGNLSNLLTYFFYGDMNLSILMSTISTILALGFMPLCIFLYGSSWIEVSSIGRMIPFGGIILTLVMTLFPVMIGMAIKSRYENIANTILKISLFSVGVSFIGLMTLSGILFGTSIFTAISGKTYVIAFVLPLLGYGFGYLLATGFRLPDASRRTIAIETGCQNSQLSSTILKMAFAKELMGAYFLFPIYYALFQALEGIGLILIFRAYRRYYADDVMVPISRITYDKFDEDWEGDGEEAGRSGGRYQTRSISDSSLHGRLILDQGSGDPGVQEVPQQLSLKKKFAPSGMMNKSSRAGDKANLIPNDDEQFASKEYGGLQ
ncbi:unnamed protein product [Clavelina lepadiformis]|uniref:Uncharacterized protein n=1 Tax=Clavelina lepadiformis TaxID=159417 RepID=A0ABP0G4P1_CLALP